MIFSLSLLAAPAARAGYTHYWTWRTQADFAELNACAAKMRPLLDARHDLLHVYEGSELDSFSEQTVLLAFNGVGDAEGEPFVFPGHAAPGETAQTIPTHNFVKTLGKPYDEVVTACLIVARECFGAHQLEIASDGTWQDWAPGAALVRRVLGHRAVNPLSDTARREAPAAGAPEGDADAGLRAGNAQAAPDEGEGEAVAPRRNAVRTELAPSRVLTLVRFCALLVLAALYVHDRVRRARAPRARTPPLG